jgi:hypothetical protein
VSKIPIHLAHFFTDSSKLRRISDMSDAQAGIVPVAGATAAQARALMRAEGIRAEDNIFTCLLYQMRDGEDKQG